MRLLAALCAAVFVYLAVGFAISALVGVIFGSGDRIGGERLYGSDRLIRLMLGSFQSELTPIEGRTPWGDASVG